jgi:hypothetical protein
MLADPGGTPSRDLSDQYHAALQCYASELQAYWTRITAYVLLNSALLVARSALPLGPADHWVRIGIATLGCVTTLLWAHTAVRAHYIAGFWLALLHDLERRLGMGETGPFGTLHAFYGRRQVILPSGIEARLPWYARANVNDSTSAILTFVFLALWIVALVRLA